MSGYFNQDNWDSSADYLILDDIPWERLKTLYKSLFGGQRHFTICDKYRPKLDVEWGKPVIFLCNAENDPFSILQRHDPVYEWLEGNCTYVNLLYPLFY